jgi:UDP-galactopyranose mutase
MVQYDFLIVGAGFSGLVIAERLKSINKKVLVIEKRNHIGGNCYDFYDQYGVLVHQYGPHYFRTNDDSIFNYLSNFTKWRPYEYRIRSYVDGELFPFPINLDGLNKFFKINLQNEEEARELLESKKVPIETPKNAEEQVLKYLGRELYEKFFKNYTIKQWKTDPKNLNPSITARIPIRYNNDDRYFTERIQAMPLNGYTELFNNLADGVEIWYDSDYFKIKNDISYKTLIYTGAIDEFLSHQFGPLPYRSLNFEFEHHEKDFYQDWVQINYPNDFDYTRIVEIKHATGQACESTTIVKEYPSDIGEPFYPIPNSENRLKYSKYKEEFEKLKDHYFIGRLATYRYLNMDQVVKEALDFFQIIKNK